MNSEHISALNRRGLPYEMGGSFGVVVPLGIFDGCHFSPAATIAADPRQFLHGQIFTDFLFSNLSFENQKAMRHNIDAAIQGGKYVA